MDELQQLIQEYLDFLPWGEVGSNTAEEIANGIRKAGYRKEVRAHWVDITPEGCKYGRRFKCSRCGRGVALVPMQYDQGVSARYPYCHCGANMDEEGD